MIWKTCHTCINTSIKSDEQRPSFPQINFGLSFCDNKSNIWGVYASINSTQSDFKPLGIIEQTFSNASSTSFCVV